MTKFFRNYKALLIGFFSTLLLVIILSIFSLLLIDPNAIIENVIFFLFWWIIISAGIHNIKYFKKNRQVLYFSLVLISLLIIAVVVDASLKIPDNPITITLIVLFWIGVFYLFAPQFFLKYKLPILLLYGVILSYFFYVRLGYDTNSYFQHYKERVIGFLLIPIPIIVALYLFEQWKWLRTLKSEKYEAELELLKSQINPHFFFNTLNNLYGLTVEKSDLAPEVVLKLSDVMRYSIYEGKKSLVLLKQEVSFLKNYIELHKIRYQKKVTIRFTNTIDTDYLIAPLLFIILLENAFKHGVERLMEDAYVHVELSETNSILTFSIENNYTSNSLPNDIGIGLSNLKQRLHLIYPKKHTLEIKKETHTYFALLKIDTT